MSPKDHSVSDLAFLFKMAPLMRELDSVDRLYRLLLSMATAGRSVGFAKAMLFAVDEQNGVVRGRFGAERPGIVKKDTESFDERAKSVFSIYEGIDGTDLTLKARSFSVPIAWHRSGLVKAARTAHPVLAEKQLTEFASDPFFDFFNIKRYLAAPIKLNGRVASVVAVEMSSRKAESAVEDVSLLYSLTQLVAGTAQSLLTVADHKRRARIVWKLQQLLQGANSIEKLDEALRLGAIMVARAIGSSGCLIKDFVRHKSVHIKTVHEHSPEASDDDVAIGECMDAILNHAAGTVQVIAGDHKHALVTTEAAKAIEHFYATPLEAHADVSGAMAVYIERAADDQVAKSYSADDRHFVALCAGIIAAALEAHQLDARVKRAEDFNEEVSSNLAREREHARRAENSFDYHLSVAGELEELREILSAKTPYGKRFPQISKIVRRMQRSAQKHVASLKPPESHLAPVDIFDATRDAVQGQLESFREAGVEVTTRIPPGGPKLLMDKRKITLALNNILSATRSFLAKGNKMLVECSSAEDRVLLCFADNGVGVPGDAISRLLMPFDSATETDERKRALSLAGEIIEKHAGDILVKSSMSWRTILILSFPKAANRERRKSRRDRRRRSERRVEVSSS